MLDYDRLAAHFLSAIFVKYFSATLFLLVVAFRRAFGVVVFVLQCK